jgi:hypothetical protein
VAGLCRGRHLAPLAFLALTVVLGTLGLGAVKASAAAGPSGIYIVVDPYNTVQLSQLTAAAQEPSCQAAEPYCTSSNGILLTVDWCRFQGYPDTSAPGGGTKDFSCHYYLTKAGSGATTKDLPANEDTHQCPGSQAAPSYDTDSGCTTSDLKTALADIIMLNLLRHNYGSGRPALHLSLGLMAGSATPEFVLLAEQAQAANGVAAPLNIALDLGTQTNGTHVYGCGLEPQVWLPSYATPVAPPGSPAAAYLIAYDAFIAAVSTTMANATASGQYGSPITLVKLTPLNATTLEYNLPGYPSTPPVSLIDPKTGQDKNEDLPINCKSTDIDGADQWINAYANTGLSGYSVIQAMEQTFGYSVGNIYAELKLQNQTPFGISIATNDSQALPDINCGLTGAGITGTSCQAQSISTDQWSTYYLFEHAVDLFTAGSVAQLAAKTAAKDNGNYTFALGKSQLYINTTNLQDPTTYPNVTCPNFENPSNPTGNNDCPQVSLASFACGLNETAAAPAGGEPADEQVFSLTPTTTPPTPTMNYPEPGIGTQLAVQTQVNLDGSKGGTDYCTAPSGSTSLSDIFNYAIANGTQFIEITPDLAADSACYMPMQSALVTLLSPPNANCLY